MNSSVKRGYVYYVPDFMWNAFSLSSLCDVRYRLKKFPSMLGFDYDCLLGFVKYFFCLTVLPLLNLNAAMQDMMFGAVAAILQP